jgi:hypothetical protein
LRSQRAEARNISLTFYAYAAAGYTGDLGPVTQALANNLEGCLQGAKPQECSNILWALGKLSDHWRHGSHNPLVESGTYNESVFSWALGQLAYHLEQRHQQLNSQSISNAVYGCALAGHVEGLPQFLALVCQHMEVMDRALAQHWSNTVWGIATIHEKSAAGHREQLAGELQGYGLLILARYAQTTGVMTHAKPQDWSNTVWAAAKLGCSREGALLLKQLAMNPQAMTGAEPQAWANTVWAAATLYEAAAAAGNKQLAQLLHRSGQMLLAMCEKKWGTLVGATPQNLSNIIWAAAKLGCMQQGAQLLSQLASNLHAMAGATPQAWSNILWAAAVLRWYDQGLFSQGLTELTAMAPVAIKPQGISNTLWACAFCAHWDSGVQQLLGRVLECDLTQFSGQDLANTSWAWAVLVCLANEDGSYKQHEQCSQQVAAALFKAAASRHISSFTEEGQRQLYAAYLYASDLGIPGLPTGPVLEATKVGLVSSLQKTTDSQRAVAEELSALGCTTQLESLSPDGVMRADIVITALPDGTSCSIAVEYDGSHHYIEEHTSSGAVLDRLEGRTHLRNALLSRSFPDGVVCIYWRDWAAVEGDKEAEQEYLREALGKVVKDKVGTPTVLDAGCSCTWSSSAVEGRKCNACNLIHPCTG